jgi:hypothetical protein
MRKEKRKRSMKMRKIMKKRRNMRMSKQKRKETLRKRNLSNLAMARRKRTKRTVSIVWWLPLATSKERCNFKDSNRKRHPGETEVPKLSLIRISQG